MKVQLGHGGDSMESQSKIIRQFCRRKDTAFSKQSRFRSKSLNGSFLREDENRLPEKGKINEKSRQKNIFTRTICELVEIYMN
jgi:hypothetical protein